MGECGAMIRKTVCELFAGVGGFRLGLERSSKEWETVWANQWEPGKKANMHSTAIAIILVEQRIMSMRIFQDR